jgi:predicted DNA-binding transcriptional regulator YafY
VQQILSYGKDVEIIAPKSLKKEMKEHTVALHKFYN